MNKKLIKNLLIIGLLSLSLFFLNFNPASAQTLTAGKLEISYPGSGALFNETNIAPGFEVVKTVSVKNTGSVAHSFSIAVSGSLGSLADVLQIEPRDFGTNIPIWNKTVSNIAKSPDSDLILGSIAPGQTRQVNIAAILPESIGNEYQDKSTFAFDFVIGNESTDPTEPTNQNSNTNSSISTNLTSVFAVSRNSNTNAGGANSNSNNANDNSNSSLNNNENTNAVSVALDNEGKAQGATTDNGKVCFWWWMLWAVMAVFLVIYGAFFKKRKGWFFLIWPTFFGVIIYVVHWILHDYYTPSKWCGWWFVGILLAEIVIYYIVGSKNTETEK